MMPFKCLGNGDGSRVHMRKHPHKEDGNVIALAVNSGIQSYILIQTTTACLLYVQLFLRNTINVALFS